MQPKTYQLQYMWTSFQQQIFCPYNCLLKDLNPKKKFGFVDPATQNHCDNLVVPEYCVDILSYFQASFAVPEARRRHYGLYFFFWVSFAVPQVSETRRRYHGFYFFLQAFCVAPEKRRHYVPCFQIFSVKNEHCD